MKFCSTDEKPVGYMFVHDGYSPILEPLNARIFLGNGSPVCGSKPGNIVSPGGEACSLSLASS